MSPSSEQRHRSPPSSALDGQALAHIAASLFSSRETHPVLQGVVAAARDLAAADAAMVLLYDREQALFLPAVPSVAIGMDERWLQRQGLEGAQILALRAVQAHDVIEMLDMAGTPALDLPMLDGGRYPGAVCVAPLEVDGTVVGVVKVFAAHPRASGYDTDTLRAFATLAALAIANAQAHERERSLRARQEALDAASKVLAAELSLGQVLQRIVEIAASIAGARYGALGVVGTDGYLSDFITTGLSTEERERIGHLPRGHGLLGVLIRRGEPLRVPNIQRDPRRVGFPPNHPPMTSLLGMPIRVHNEVVGDLYLTDKIGGPAFSEDDQHLVEMLAAHAGIAIENARLYAALGELTLLRERERISRDLHDGIIQNIYGATLHLEDVAEDLQDEAKQARLLGVADQLTSVIGDVRTYIQGLRARAGRKATR